jgi:SAM-dependent methyltransferase
MRAVTCALCGADDARAIFSGPDRDLPADGERYTVRQCRRCGLVYLSPRPDGPDEIARIYPEEYHAYVRRHTGARAALRELAWLPELREIAAMTRSDSPILELGCATGEFLARLRRHGRTTLQGVEFNPRAAELARARHGLPVVAGELTDARLPGGSFEVVVMRHMLEHTGDPVGLLREVRRLLKPGGAAIFTIPNVDSAGVRLFRHNWYGWAVPRHFYGFPRRTLDPLLRRAGLELAAVRHPAAPNMWVGSLRYWLEERGAVRLSRLFRYDSPLAVALLAPVGVISALAHSNGVLRVIARRPMTP